MDIGKLNKRIAIQKRKIFIDENGFEVETWEDYKTIWASIKNLNGKEFFQAQQTAIYFFLKPQFLSVFPLLLKKFVIILICIVTRT